MSDWIVSTRRKTKDSPTHHLCRVAGVWYIALTLINKDTYQTTRHRQSLRTKDLAVAMSRRDKVLAAVYATYGEEVK